MATELRKTGIDAVGDIPWGTHFCHFYETQADLLDTLVPYFKAGLENSEFCLWVISEPLTEEEVLHSLGRVVPDLDRYRSDGSMEILPGRDWYLREGVVDPKRVTGAWKEKLDRALARDFAGMRACGDTSWLERKDWADFCEYEKTLNEAIVDWSMSVVCTYPITRIGPAEILDVARTHQFALARRSGNLEVIETPQASQSKEEANRRNEELGQRVAERTMQLSAINEALLKEINTREQAEKSLRRSEAYLAEGQRLSQTGSWAWSVSAGELFWSLEHFRIFGLDHERTKPSYELFFRTVHPEDQALTRQAFEKAVSSGSDYALDYRILRPDGSVRHIHSLAHPVFDEAGELTEYVGTIIDTTERVRAETFLLKANERVEMVLESITENFFAVDNKWRYTLFNKHAEEQFKVLGIDPSSLIGKVLWDVFPNSTFEEKLRRAMLERTVMIDEQYYPPLGEWYENRIYPTPDGGLSIFQRYVTERKRAEEELQKAQSELAHVVRVTTIGELTASIAHEVNQPLGAIVTNGQACLRLLSRRAPDIGAAREAAEAMIGDAMRASEVIKHVRALLRKAAPEKELLDINEIIQEVVALTSNDLVKNQVIMRTELGAGLPSVEGDRVQLQQVVLNLILNGNEAMSADESQPRELLISSQATKPEELTVSVRDTGTGFTPQDGERIFDTFFTTKNNGGLGLGLSISRTIIEVHGGRLWATANEASGSTFRFTLPASARS